MLDAAHWVFILPIKTVLTIIFNQLVDVIGNYGLAVIALSLVVNTLLLPVWQWGESLQQRERQRQQRMSHHLQAIKRAFRGELRFAMTRTVHRIYHYHPYYALQSSVGLLLQIPFFIAAYQLLGHVDAMEGVSFGPLADLMQPDALLPFGPFRINLLPLLMTLLNLAASFFYTRSLDRGSKVQLYLIALLFLLLLYRSPSALLLYWSCNNAFSLAKLMLRRLPPSAASSPLAVGQTFYLRLRGPRILAYLLLFAGALLFVQYVRVYRVSLLSEAVLMTALIALVSYFALLAVCSVLGWPAGTKRGQGLRLAVMLLLLCAVGWQFFQLFQVETDYQSKGLRRSMFVMLSLFAVIGLWPQIKRCPLWPTEEPLSVWHLFLPCCLLIVLAMLYAPAALLASSPDEVAAAATWLFELQLPRTLFLLVLALILALLSNSRRLAAIVLNAALLLALLNTFLPLGNYDQMVNFTILDVEQLSVGWPLLLFDLGLMMVLPLAVAWLLRRRSAWLQGVQIAALLVVGGSTATNLATLARERNNQSPSTTISSAPLVLSRNQPNVVVLMLDRFVGPYLADILQDVPQLAEQLDGFRWYPNTVSVSGNTIGSLPAIFGGYNYTITALNQQPEKTLTAKIDQAYRVLPSNFAAANYRNVIVDPQLAGGNNRGACRPFEDLPRTDCILLNGRFTFDWAQQEDFLTQNNLLAIYGTFRIAPASLRLFVYALWDRVGNQNTQALAYRTFVDSWSVLDRLPRLSRSEQGSGTLLLMNNLATHDPLINDHEQPQIDPYMRAEDIQRFHDRSSTQTYYVDRAALKKLVGWFAWMKSEGVYDNTRIILVSDHGHGAFSPFLQQHHRWEDGEDTRTRMRLLPLLLVKDFGQCGKLVWESQLMSNADVPHLATAGLVAQPIDYDGSPLKQQKDLPVDSYLTPWFLNMRKRTLYPIEEHWQLVKPEVWDQSSWRRLP